MTCVGVELDLGEEGLRRGGEGDWTEGDAAKALPVAWTLVLLRTQGPLGDSEHGEAWFVEPEKQNIHNFIIKVFHYYITSLQDYSRKQTGQCFT